MCDTVFRAEWMESMSSDSGVLIQESSWRMSMGPKEFRHWRKSLGLKQKEAAAMLGLKKRMIQYYEKGERDGKTIVIPKYIRLACYAVGEGITDFDGETAQSQIKQERSPVLKMK